jgi:hypothetical protein
MDFEGVFVILIQNYLLVWLQAYLGGTLFA